MRVIPNRAWAQALNRPQDLTPQPGRQVTSQRHRGPEKLVLRDLMYG